MPPPLDTWQLNTNHGISRDTGDLWRAYPLLSYLYQKRETLQYHSSSLYYPVRKPLLPSIVYS